MKKHLSTIILVLVFLLGLSLLLYPSISNFVNERNASRAVAAYDAAVAEMTQEDYDAWFAAAGAYNEALAANPSAFYDPTLVSGYEDILDVTGTGIMGYVTISKIGVNLPIYHGTSDGVLQIAAGHLEGTSLPVGGSSTHAVLSGHRGLPSAKLFTDLDRLEVGDTFEITVLNRTITYEVDLISIVEPSEVDGLQIEDGADLCTLVTCTPYGVNSHRLLVRGHRVENASDLASRVTSDATEVSTVLVAAVYSVPLVFVLLVVLLVRTRVSTRRRKHRGTHYGH